MRLLALALLVLLLAAAPARGAGPRRAGGRRRLVQQRADARARAATATRSCPGEYLYYGFQLAAGQRLQVTLTHPDIDNVAVQRMGVLYLAGNIHTPTRTSASTPGGDNATARLRDRRDRAARGLQRRRSSADEDDGDSGPWAGAGVYYLALHAV